MRQGFGPGNGRVLTFRMHSVGIGRERGMSTMPGAAGRACRCAHRSIAQGFELRRAPDVHTAIGPQFQRIPTFTIEIHSAKSRCRQKISTPSDPCLVDATCALTFPMHRIASRSGGTISTSRSPRLATFRRAGTGVDIATRGHAKPCEFRRRASARDPTRTPIRVWTDRSATTRNAVNFDGERRHDDQARAPIRGRIPRPTTTQNTVNANGEQRQDDRARASIRVWTARSMATRNAVKFDGERGRDIARRRRFGVNSGARNPSATRAS